LDQALSQTDDLDLAAKRAARHLQVIDEMVELGLALGYDICLQARQDGRAAEAGLSFSRVSKAVRQSVLLSAHLTDENLSRGKRHAAERGERLARQRIERAQANRVEVRTAIEALIDHEAPAFESERLYKELAGRLEDAEDLLADADPDDLIARIKLELGLVYRSLHDKPPPTPPHTSPPPGGEGPGVGVSAPTPREFAPLPDAFEFTRQQPPDQARAPPAPSG
jgi:hypothetical protein